ncbi:hypothetical protein HYQ46_006991 [Verticillium longisporum]|uniref:Uncharacterized protein n=1 Tax=Verticillium dahliae (strain VdLs.17 / ATCC MYA-4575 / FGSC 10137) TaxID=498257 RepID=G2XFG1_VERDV|nr:uncharacterized protein VDAG_09085 [Verticillium dahliae VdLs.17]EGY18559.1 hypothetical protein VDAG_09085 [Verticillium dahliae VdLs.17]KAG7144271.1 hypothetical protein HYQ46_006991 [Verticillium longisporum]
MTRKIFQVQLLENLEDQPVEYAGKEWDSEKYPWQTVAKLVIPKQESLTRKRTNPGLTIFVLIRGTALSNFNLLGARTGFDVEVGKLAFHLLRCGR